MYYNFPRKAFPMYYNHFIASDKHYAIFFKDTWKNAYAISMNVEPIYDYCGNPVLKIIDLNTFDKQDPDFVWKVFEQTLKELEVTEDF